jgi:phosphate uptake regulator
MSRPRRYFEPDNSSSQRGPSDEMLAVDAATELRSLTLLYERYADHAVNAGQHVIYLITGKAQNE